MWDARYYSCRRSVSRIFTGRIGAGRGTGCICGREVRAVPKIGKLRFFIKTATQRPSDSGP
jgi:hypothetical protein